MFHISLPHHCFLLPPPPPFIPVVYSAAAADSTSNLVIRVVRLSVPQQDSNMRSVAAWQLVMQHSRRVPAAVAQQVAAASSTCCSCPNSTDNQYTLTLVSVSATPAPSWPSSLAVVARSCLLARSAGAAAVLAAAQSWGRQCSSNSSSRRGFFSLMQPDSKVYRERRLIG